MDSLKLKYDRAGRSDGIAFVTYLNIDDAKEAIRKFDGANAAGQPITVALDADVPARRPGPIESRPPRFGGPRRGGPRPSRGGRLAGGSQEHGSGRDGRPKRTTEDLDKELDAFMNAPAPGEDGTAAEGEEMAVD